MASIKTLSLSVLLFATDLFAASFFIELDTKPNFITSCKEGLIADVDKFIFTARVTADEKTLERHDLFFMDIYHEGISRPNDFCWVNFAKVCDKKDAIDGCYCKGYSNGIFEIVINKTAEMIDSGGLLQISWLRFPNYTNSNRVPLPVVYPKANEILNIGESYVQHEKKCYISLSVGDIIYWCVTHLLGATLTIEFPSERSAEKSSCVKATVTPKMPLKGYFNVSYQEHSGCMRSAVYTCHYDQSKLYRPYMSVNGCQTPSMFFGWISFMMIGFFLGTGNVCLQI